MYITSVIYFPLWQYLKVFGSDCLKDTKRKQNATDQEKRIKLDTNYAHSTAVAKPKRNSAIISLVLIFYSNLRTEQSWQEYGCMNNMKCMHIQTYIYIYMHMYMYMYIQTYMHIHIHSYANSISLCIYTRTYIYTHIYIHI